MQHGVNVMSLILGFLYNCVGGDDGSLKMFWANRLWVHRSGLARW
jgi:hypothetical protein